MTLRWLAGAAAPLAAPALAVGLGPLAKSGLTDAPAKAFWLTLINSDPKPKDFAIYALDAEWRPIQGVEVFPAVPRLAPGKQRRVLAIIRNLTPGETRVVRVCAEPTIQEGTVHARVCSKLTARRVAGAAGG